MSAPFQEYVCGFLFFKQCMALPTSRDVPSFELENHVLLILKDRPLWQAGKFNGIGGKVEKNEIPFDAMVRECHEESGLLINDWKYYALMTGPNYKVYFYRAFHDIIPVWSQKTSELLQPFAVKRLPPNLIKSNRYLIPMALDGDVKNVQIHVE